MPNSQLVFPLALGGVHGVADGAAGFLLGDLARLHPLPQVALLVLLYNAIAFGSQPIFGLLCDRVQCPRVAAFGGLLFLAAGLTLRSQSVTAVLVAGLGSAAFHVGAGALAIRSTLGSAVGPGCFVAPGVVGLAVGGAMAVGGYDLPWLLLLLLCGTVLARFPLPVLPDRKTSTEPFLEGSEGLLLVLLGAIALRSALWNSLQLVQLAPAATQLPGGSHPLPFLLALSVAAAVGKGLGGWLADRWGWRRWAIVALLLSTPLLVFCQQAIAPLLLGIALLQSVAPLTLAATAQWLPQFPATSAGLVLGLAIAIGSFPLLGSVSEIIVQPWVLGAIAIGVTISLAWVLPKPLP